MKHHIPATENMEQHRRLLAWREWVFGPVFEQAEEVLRKIGYDELD